MIQVNQGYFHKVRGYIQETIDFRKIQLNNQMTHVNYDIELLN